MASCPPNTVIVPCWDGIDRTESERELQWIKEHYEEDLLVDDMNVMDAVKRHDMVSEWYQWCDREYPGTESKDWQRLAISTGEDVDIRVLIRAFPIAGYSILLFFEACYAVDKTLYGEDEEALTGMKKWHIPQEMRAYKYILSEKMMRWWARELAALEDEMKSPFSNQIFLSWRTWDLYTCFLRLDKVMKSNDGIGSNIWTTMGESDDLAVPPASLESDIYARFERFKTSIFILRRTIERREQLVSDILHPTGHGAVESGGQSLGQNGSHGAGAPMLSSGIRRRIPNPPASSVSELDVGAGQTRIVNEEIDSNILSIDDTLSTWVNVKAVLRMTQYLHNLQYLKALFSLTKGRITNSIARYKAKRLLAWLIQKETATLISICLVATSMFFIGWSFTLVKSTIPSSEQSSLSDPNFLGNLSQSILSNLSIFLMIALAVRNQSVGLSYRSWFWLCLLISSLSSALGLSFYATIPGASLLFLWTAAFAQVVIPVLLVIQTKTSSTENGADVERHAD